MLDTPVYSAPVPGMGNRAPVRPRWVKLVRDVALHPYEGVPVRSPRDVYEACREHMAQLEHEIFVTLVLDAQHRIRSAVQVTSGTLNSSLVHPREAFRIAIAYGAAAVVFVHNHPSGDPTPSSNDRAVTEQLVAAGRLLDIPVHDHVIVGNGRYVSFAEAGLL
jgi:DNA repair protein RadC